MRNIFGNYQENPMNTEKLAEEIAQALLNSGHAWHTKEVAGVILPIITRAACEGEKAEAFDWSPFKPPFDYEPMNRVISDSNAVVVLRIDDRKFTPEMAVHLATLMNEGSELKALRERLEKLAQRWERNKFQHIGETMRTLAQELREAMKGGVQ